jgi:hypothetical protein
VCTATGNRGLGSGGSKNTAKNDGKQKSPPGYNRTGWTFN